MNKLHGTIPLEMGTLSDLDLLLIEQNDFIGNAEAICSSSLMNVGTFVSDCGSQTNFTCSCCTECCNPSDALCNDWVWKGNLDPVWEYGYRSERYAYDMGPVIWKP
eukprot:scaffold5817_cov101-Cylindrotheca_fusiformis.AAC.5